MRDKITLQKNMWVSELFFKSLRKCVKKHLKIHLQWRRVLQFDNALSYFHRKYNSGVKETFELVQSKSLIPVCASRCRTALCTKTLIKYSSPAQIKLHYLAVAEFAQISSTHARFADILLIALNINYIPTIFGYFTKKCAMLVSA